MRISDWSSDVCSSDLSPDADARMSRHGNAAQGAVEVARGDVHVGDATEGPGTCRNRGRTGAERSAIAGTTDRTSVVSGKSVSVRVDLGGGGLIQKKN